MVYYGEEMDLVQDHIQDDYILEQEEFTDGKPLKHEWNICVEQTINMDDLLSQNISVSR